MKPEDKKQVAKVLLAAASKLEASGFDFQPGRVYSFEELPTQVQGDIEQQFDDPDEINEWRFKAELWQPERIPELFDEAGDTAVFHIGNWKGNKTGIVDIKELDDPSVREQFIRETPKLPALMKSIKSKGVEHPAVGQEGYHRAIASYLLGKPLPYLALVRPNEDGQLSASSDRHNKAQEQKHWLLNRGCVAWAKAYKDIFGGKLFDVVEPEPNNTWALYPGRPHHVVVKTKDGVLHDATGPYANEQELLSFWEERRAGAGDSGEKLVLEPHNGKRAKDQGLVARDRDYSLAYSTLFSRKP